MKKLLFVCGFPGGGTDLTKTILNAHPQVYINGEMPLLKNLIKYGYDGKTLFRSISEVEAFKDVLKQINTWGNIQNLDHNFHEVFQDKPKLTLEDVLGICFSEQERQIWGNKTPQNTENMEALLNLFPNALFLIVVRDVRDVCLSWRDKWGKYMELVASKWAQRMMHGWRTTRGLPDDQYLFIRFEDLLATTEKCRREICSFLEIPFSERMLEHNKFTAEKLDGKINYGREILPENKEKWRHSLPSRTTQRIEEIAYDTMTVFNYDIEYAEHYKPISDMEKARGVFNDTWAALFTGNRSSQQNSFGQRIGELAWELRKRL